MTPKLTIGVPVYNGERFLAVALESLLSQTFTDFELLISDNGSTDRTLAICREYQERDARIRVYPNGRNLGAAHNYNRLVDLARGRYFKWASHDDKCAPTFLERCVELLDSAPADVVMCSTRTVVIDQDGWPVEEYSHDLELRDARAYRRIARLVNQLQMCNCVFGVVRTDALRSTRLIGRYPGSDIVLLSELALRGQIWQIPEPLFYRRVHDDMSRKKHRSAADSARWFDPQCGHWMIRFEATRRLWEQCKGILDAPLPGHEKALCLAGAAAYRPLRAARVQLGAWRRQWFAGRHVNAHG